VNKRRRPIIVCRKKDTLLVLYRNRKPKKGQPNARNWKGKKVNNTHGFVYGTTSSRQGNILKRELN